MTAMELARGVAILSPIFGLLMMGLAITLRSGVANLSTEQGLRQLAGNFSQLVLRLGIVLVVLVMVQHMVGFRLGLLG